MLRDVNRTDTSTTFLGRKITMPVALAPIGSIERFDPNATASVADAAGTFGCPMFQSSVSKPEVEDTGKVVPNGLKIFQLYVRGDQAWVEAIFDRAVKAGFGALCLTVDTHHYSRRERDISKRYHAASSRDPSARRTRRRWTGRRSTRSRRSTSCPSSSRASPPPRTPSSPSSTVST